MRCKNDTQILDFYHTEYQHRELFTSGIKENYTLFNLLLSLTSLNISCIILQDKMSALNSAQDKIILPSKSLVDWGHMSHLNLTLGFRQERMTAVQHLSTMTIIPCVELIAMKHA